MKGGKTNVTGQRCNLEKIGRKVVSLRHKNPSPAEYGSMMIFQSRILYSTTFKFVWLQLLSLAERFV
jgi:hypothetical protein